jgi:hypothetical protein
VGSKRNAVGYLCVDAEFAGKCCNRTISISNLNEVVAYLSTDTDVFPDVLANDKRRVALVVGGYTIAR